MATILVFRKPKDTRIYAYIVGTFVVQSGELHCNNTLELTPLAFYFFRYYKNSNMSSGPIQVTFHPWQISDDIFTYEGSTTVKHLQGKFEACKLVLNWYCIQKLSSPPPPPTAIPPLPPPPTHTHTHTHRKRDRDNFIFWGCGVGVGRPLLKIFALFQTKVYNLLHPISDLTLKILCPVSDHVRYGNFSNCKIYHETNIPVCFYFCYGILSAATRLTGNNHVPNQRDGISLFQSRKVNSVPISG